MFLYIYIEKKKVYNIEGQLRGLQGSVHPKTCTPKVCTPWCFLLVFKILAVYTQSVRLA